LQNTNLVSVLTDRTDNFVNSAIQNEFEKNMCQKDNYM